MAITVFAIKLICNDHFAIKALIFFVVQKNSKPIENYGIQKACTENYSFIRQFIQLFRSLRVFWYVSYYKLSVFANEALDPELYP